MIAQPKVRDSKVQPLQSRAKVSSAGNPQTLGSQYEITSAAATPDHHLNIHFFKEGQGDYCVINGAFYHHVESGCWKHVSDEKMQSIIANELKKLYSVDARSGNRSYKFATARHLTSSFAFNRSGIAVSSSDRPDSSCLINFRNGVLNTATGVLEPYSKNLYLTAQIESDYIPNQECPEEFQKFIDKCYGRTQTTLIRAMIRYYIDFSLPYGYFLHCMGQSRSGKGTLIRFIGSLHGSFYKQLNEFRSFNSAEGRYQNLTGVRVLGIPDITQALPDPGSFYELVDNGELSGRPLFSSASYSTKWGVRFLLGSVDPIRFEKSSGGWDGRCIPLKTLDRDGSPQDLELSSRLESCRAGVISWAMAMDRDQVKDVLLNPGKYGTSHDELKDAQAIATDSVKSFIDACLIPCDPEGTIDKSTVFGWYQAYCKASGLAAKGKNIFYKDMKSALGGLHEIKRTSEPIGRGLKRNVPAKFRGLCMADPCLFEQRIAGDGSHVKGDREDYICNPRKESEGGLRLFREVREHGFKILEPISDSEPVQTEPVSQQPIQTEFAHGYKIGDRVEYLTDKGEWIDCGMIVDVLPTSITARSVKREAKKQRIPLGDEPGSDRYCRYDGPLKYAINSRIRIAGTPEGLGLKPGDYDVAECRIDGRIRVWRGDEISHWINEADFTPIQMASH